MPEPGFCFIITLSMKRPIHNQAGFTIVELLITLTILTTAYIAFNSLFVSVEHISDRSNEFILANAAAAAKMQAYENTQFENINIADLQEEIEVEDFEPSLPAELNGPRSAKVYSTMLSPTLKRVRVTITYEDFADGEEVTYVNLIHESGLGR